MAADLGTLKANLNSFLREIDTTEKEIEALSKIELIDKHAYEIVKRLLAQWDNLKAYNIHDSHKSVEELKAKEQAMMDTLSKIHSREIAFWRLIFQSLGKINGILERIKSSSHWPTAEVAMSIRLLISAAEDAKVKETEVFQRLRVLHDFEAHFNKQIQDLFSVIAGSGDIGPLMPAVFKQLDALCNPIRNNMAGQNRALNFGEIVNELKAIREELEKLKARTDDILNNLPSS